jgi:hypothetical protein
MMATGVRQVVAGGRSSRAVRWGVAGDVRGWAMTASALRPLRRSRGKTGAEDTFGREN